MRSERRMRRLLAFLACTTLAAGVGVVASGSPASAAEIVPVPASGNITISGHGYGHGHGMSQYGARGAALQGLDAAHIVAFYYPGTTLAVQQQPTIRVGMSGAGTYTMVSGATSVTGYNGALSPSARYRLVPQTSATGFQLQTQSGTTWNTVSAAPLPGAQADFSSAVGYVRMYRSDGTSADYRGTVGAVRSGAGQVTVNRVALDSYVQGVVPRESPSYWEPAALQAQAIAVRTYGRNAEESHVSALYDICDTEMCQVYGGLARYSITGTRFYGEEATTNAAVVATSNKVLQYNSATIFAQFSASSGGWTTDGGKPYLPAQADPYDNVASGDPYLNWTRSVPVASIASSYGLSKVTQLEITAQDGHGDWGGRVSAGYVDGIDGSGNAQRIATTGFTLQAAMGMPHNWFHVLPAAGSPFGQVDAVIGAPSKVTASGWAIDADSSAPIMVQMYVDYSANTVTWASQSRPDVGAVYPAAGPNRGYTLTMQATPGQHTVCLYGINTGPGSSNQLGCRVVNVPTSDPFGQIDAVNGAPSKVTASGWAIDADSSAPIMVQMYVDYSANTVTWASQSRPDVGAVYPAAGPNRGYTLTMQATPGPHTLCLYGINTGPGSSRQLGCRAVNVP